MRNEIQDFTSKCAQIDFGTVELSNEENNFSNELNNEIISLCRSLPKPTQTDALLLIMRYCGIRFGNDVNFINYYYAPSWSIIYWLIKTSFNRIRLNQAVKRFAKTAHSMTLFLHSFDDHLNDSEIPTTHLSLLIRSQSWMIMKNALGNLAHWVDDGHEIVQSFIDDYYSSITSSKEVESLDSYCLLFRKQIATWLIVPTLMATKIANDVKFVDAIQTAYSSFAISWRLLDDIQDIESDMLNGVHSSIYISLSENMRNQWDKVGQQQKDKHSGLIETILDQISENKVIYRLANRICKELESAASIADSLGIPGLADEYRSLLRPLRDLDHSK